MPEEHVLQLTKSCHLPHATRQVGRAVQYPRLNQGTRAGTALAQLGSHNSPMPFSIQNLLQ